MTFPAGFAWGAATASYQVEGGAKAGGRGPSIWDTFAHTPGRIFDGATGDVAVDSYHRYEEDVALLADLGLTHYRFSLAWPRIQPDGRGPVNGEGLAYYDRLVDALLARGITPWVTLYHWDLPQPLEDAGGWPNRDTAQRFAEYATVATERLSDRVRAWTTLNEPWCAAFLGYANGVHAPGRTEPQNALRAAHHLLLGHGLAVRALRERDPAAAYGITLNLFPVEPADDTDSSRDAARRIDGLANRIFLDPVLRGRYPDDVPLPEALVRDDDEAVIAAPLDFLGVNYYNRHVVRAGDGPRAGDRPSAWVGGEDVEFVGKGLPRTEMGWEIDPDGLFDVLTRVDRDYGPLPIYVTENGIACPDELGADGRVHDADRIEYLDRHFAAARRAIEAGVDLRGYFVWTLLDNFEWSWGFTKTFGLVHVDVAGGTLARTPKDSAAWLAAYLRSLR